MRRSSLPSSELGRIIAEVFPAVKIIDQMACEARGWPHGDGRFSAGGMGPPKVHSRGAACEILVDGGDHLDIKRHFREFNDH
jgi:hypothetical protein